MSLDGPADGAAPPAPPPGRAARRAALALAVVSGLLVLLLVLRAWVLTPFRIATSSMEPTLRGDVTGAGEILVPGDTILVHRLAYLGSGPSRWDVVAFRPIDSPNPERSDPAPTGPAPTGPDRPGPDRTSIVKRVVGLPGELVEIGEEGGIRIDGRPAAMPPGLEALRYVRAGSFGRDPVLLGAEDYFVLGDNSYPSVDSRRFGPLPRSAIIGRVVCIIWPPDRAGFVR